MHSIKSILLRESDTLYMGEHGDFSGAFELSRD